MRWPALVLAVCVFGFALLACERNVKVVLMNDTNSAVVVQVEPQQLNSNLRWRLKPGDEQSIKLWDNQSASLDFRLESDSGALLGERRYSRAQLRTIGFRILLSTE